MNYKNLIKSVMHEAVDKLPVYEDGVPTESDIAIQQYESPYVKGADYDSTIHPEQAEELNAFQSLLRNLTGLEIGKYLSSADGLEALIQNLNKYIGSLKSISSPTEGEINQYKFKFQNFNKQKDGDRAVLNQKIAAKTLDAINKAGNDEKYLMKLAALTSVRDLISDYLRYNIKHDTTSAQKISQETELKSFKDLYDRIRSKLNVVGKEFPPKETFTYKDIDSTDSTVRMLQGKIADTIKALNVIINPGERGNSNPEKVKIAQEVFKKDYTTGKPIFEGTLTLSKKGQEAILKKLTGEKIKQLFENYLDGKIIFNDDLNTCVEFYSIKYALKALERFFPEDSQLYLEDIKHYDKMNDIERDKVIEETKDFINGSLIKLKQEFSVLSDFSRATTAGKNSKVWVSQK